MNDAILIIGYGNELRGDDAVGPRVARELATLDLPRVRSVALHQLTPELAEALSQASAAMFIDASITGAPGSVEVAALGTPELSQPLGHFSNPRALLALACAVYGRAPQAWLVTVSVVQLGFVDKLSPEAEQGVRSAVEIIRGFIGRVNRPAAKRGERQD